MKEIVNDTELLINFLEARKLHCSIKLDVVSTLQIGGGMENYCLLNAEQKSKEFGFQLISGWLALPVTFHNSNWQKQFTQHWWNYDIEKGMYLDYSPSIEKGALYIVDLDILKFCDSRLSDLDSHVGSSIIYVNGYKYIIDYGENGHHVEEIDNLSNETIFKLKFKN